MTTDDLVERLRQASGPSCDLDFAIANALGWQYRGESPAWYDAKNNWKGSCPEFTKSIDAALTLVPEGWTSRVTSLPATSRRLSGHRGVVTLWEGPTISETRAMMDEVEAATPAIATCIAALHARSALLSRARHGEG